MEYLMKGGVLYRGETEPVGKIGGWLCGNRYTIRQGTMEYQVRVQPLEQPEECCSGREYFLRGKGGQLMRAVPCYRRGQEPEQAGWPLNRTPEVDRAELTWRKKAYSLEMVSCENYLMKNQKGEVALCVMHRGIAGGWRIECGPEFEPWAICAIFVFCRYLEQENQMVVV
ncbi:hypothetical protein [Fournierella sp.]|uniref:hypothetical protein n=1 Tax=Allofournierella sp. TaxID=1940256 RepID=UPI00307976B5